MDQAMTFLTSRGEPLPTPSGVARYISDAGIALHIIEDRSVDPVEVRIVCETPNRQETETLYSTTTGSLTVLDLIRLFNKLGYSADYEELL